MTLESIMNFELGQIVKFNPDNHGYEQLRPYSKVADRQYKVKNVEQQGFIDDEGQFRYARTGRITITFNHADRIVHYSRLKILS